MSYPLVLRATARNRWYSTNLCLRIRVPTYVGIYLYAHSGAVVSGASFKFQGLTLKLPAVVLGAYMGYHMWVMGRLVTIRIASVDKIFKGTQKRGTC